MLYLISDIHGQLTDFKRILKKIAFDKKKDKMIIMGDVFDRGPDGIMLLEYIKPYLSDHSMELLLGNHELFAIMYLKGKLNERLWTAYGGENTVEVIKKMNFVEQEELLLFLEALPFYIELKSEFLGDVIVTHTGIDVDNYVLNSNDTISVKKSIEQAVQKNIYNFMVGMDIHQIPESDRKRFDKYVIVGHVPCNRLNVGNGFRFYRTDHYMDIDAGAGYKEQGGVLGCYSVTTDEDIYL